MPSFPLQKRSAENIPAHLRVLPVRISVKFDNQLQFETREIGDKWTDRMLPPKLQP